MVRQQELFNRIKQLSPFQQQELAKRLLGKSTVQSVEKKVLTAYVTSSTTKALDVEQLKSSLGQSLPSYMIPSQIIQVDHFPLLPNGKINSNALPKQVARQEKQTKASQPLEVIEQTLVDIWCKVLQTDYVEVDDNFFEIGGDSIVSIQVVSLAHQAGLPLSASDIFDYPTIEKLVVQLQMREDNQARETKGIPIPESGLIPLTPIQYWFFSLQLAKQSHWNQALRLEIDTDVSIEVLEQAIKHVISQHEALRTAFIGKDGVYYQLLNDKGATISVVKIADEQDVELSIQRENKGTQSSLILENSVPTKFVLFDMPDNTPNQLLICAHHLLIDTISWRILLEDIEEACKTISSNKSLDSITPPGYFSWALYLAQVAGEKIVKDDIHYWTSIPMKSTVELPVDMSSSIAIEANAETIISTLAIEESTALQGAVHEAYGTTVQDILLTALAKVLSHWTNRESNTIGIEGHGRNIFGDDIDNSRTIGWFTAYYPICLDMQNAGSLQNDIRRIKELVREIPNKGLSYGILRYLKKDLSLDIDIEPQLLFNYLGNSDHTELASPMFRHLSVEKNSQRSGQNKRAHLIDINCVISSGQLIVSWTYDRETHQLSTLKTLADNFISELTQLIHHCQNIEAGSYSPSDFPDAGLDQDDLDDFIDSL